MGNFENHIPSKTEVILRPVQILVYVATTKFKHFCSICWSESARGGRIMPQFEGGRTVKRNPHLNQAGSSWSEYENLIGEPLSYLLVSQHRIYRQIYKNVLLW